MCVDEEHVRALADQAAEWHKPGMKPVGSAGRYPEGTVPFDLSVS